MKRTFIFGLGAVAVIGITYLAGDALAQQKNQRAAYQRPSQPKPFAPAQAANQAVAPVVMPAQIGLVDLGQVFKKYEKFNVLSNNLSAAAKEREKELLQLQAQAKRIADERKTLKPESPDYQLKEKELKKLRVEMESFQEEAQREFLRRQSELYHSIYQEVLAEVNRLAQQYQLTLVLRFSSDEISAADPQEVIKGINRWVLYSDPGMDLTPSVLAALNARYGRG